MTKLKNSNNHYKCNGLNWWLIKQAVNKLELDHWHNIFHQKYIKYKKVTGWVCWLFILHQICLPFLNLTPFQQYLSNKTLVLSQCLNPQPSIQKTDALPTEPVFKFSHWFDAQSQQILNWVRTSIYTTALTAEVQRAMFATTTSRLKSQIQSGLYQSAVISLTNSVRESSPIQIQSIPRTLQIWFVWLLVNRTKIGRFWCQSWKVGVRMHNFLGPGNRI